MFPFHNISSLSSIVRLHLFQFTLIKYIISVPKCKKNPKTKQLLKIKEDNPSKQVHSVVS